MNIATHRRAASPTSAPWRNVSLSGADLDFPGRLYGPPDGRDAAALVLHLHGGAFTTGSLDQGGAVAHALAKAGAIVLSLAYPLAPAVRFPQTPEYIYAALSRLARTRARFGAQGKPLHVAGEEAGGNLAAVLALMARDRGGPALAGQILLSPMLDAGLATSSLRQVQAGPVGCRWADGWSAYLGGPDKADHPYAAPLQATRLAGLAPALLISAADDPLRDEVALYAERLRQAGVRVQHHVQNGSTHWPNAFTEGPAETPCLDHACGAVAAFYALAGPS